MFMERCHSFTHDSLELLVNPEVSMTKERSPGLCRTFPNMMKLSADWNAGKDKFVFRLVRCSERVNKATQTRD